ncbi:hypothetical protein BDW67DRAFT_40130 [Aspergillus spinulosporus]
MISLSLFCIFFPLIVFSPYYFVYCLGAARHAIAYRIAKCFLSLEVEVEFERSTFFGLKQRFIEPSPLDLNLLNSTRISLNCFPSALK